MIDTKELRKLVHRHAQVTLSIPIKPAMLSEFLDRLEAAEKSDAESIAMYRKARDERDDLRAKIEQMEQQAPAYWGPKHAIEGGSTTVIVSKFPVNPTDAPLYALPGAQTQGDSNVATD